MHHSPTIRLHAARHRLELATIECPHWDYESDGNFGHACCCEVQDAQHELKLARQAVKRQNQGEE